jgi:hypothetical protein
VSALACGNSQRSAGMMNREVLSLENRSVENVEIKIAHNATGTHRCTRSIRAAYSTW